MRKLGGSPHRLPGKLFSGTGFFSKFVDSFYRFVLAYR